jgi:hypothetical protein
MKSWLTKSGNAFILSAVAAGLSLLSAILILRLLNPDEAGTYTLVTSTASLIGLIGLFGQPNLISRLYARSKVPYHWRRDLINTLSISSVVIFLCILIVLIAYRFSGFQIFFVAVFSLLNVIIYTSAYMLNSYRHYIWSALLLRLTNALFVIPVGLMALGLFQADILSLLTFQLVIAAICAVLGMLALKLYLPTGLNHISALERRESFDLAILVMAHLLLDPGLIVIAGRQLSYPLIAGLGAYINLLGPFLLVWSILTQTISVEFGRNPSFPKRKILLTLWGALIPIFVLSSAILPGLADILYKGRYNDIQAIALPISLIGGLLITETVPRGFVAAVADSPTLKRYIRAQVLVTLVAGGLEILLVNLFGVYGAAWTGAILMLGRNIVGYSYFLMVRRQLRSSA